MIRKYGSGGSASFSGKIALPRGYSRDGTTFYHGGSGPIRRIRASGLACLAVLGLLALPLHLFSQPGKESYRYAVVMKSAAYQDAGWKAVADTLLAMHGKTASKLFLWNSEGACRAAFITRCCAATAPSRMTRSYTCGKAVRRETRNGTGIASTRREIMNVKLVIANSLRFAFTTGFLAQASAQQMVVAQNGLPINGKTYQGCEDTYLQNGNLYASKNFGSSPILHLEN